MMRETPVTGSEWCDKHFRLPAGSSQTAGQWTTMPLQVVPLNMMCNRAIRCVTWQKSARIGYSKVLVGASTCLQAQFGTNTLIYQPTEEDAKDFTIDEIDAAWEEMPIMPKIFPALHAKNEKNTVKKKVGLGWTLDVKGAGTPKNMRRMTKGALFGDEVDGWDWELGKEGSPIKLARTRLEGAAFPMERWGTTPTVAGESHIEVLMAQMDLTFRFYLPCPHCGHEQVLVWGDKDSKHGMKWDNTKHSKRAKAKTAHYCCIGCDDKFYYQQLASMQEKGRWIAEDGTWTTNGIDFFSSENEKEDTPRTVGIHCWAGYSLNLSEGWIGLVDEFLGCGKDPTKLKPFINLVLGELWEGDNKDRPDWEIIKRTNSSVWWKGERRSAPVPDQAQVLTGGIDTQDDRVEMSIFAWGLGEECWLVEHIIVDGDLSQQVTKDACKKFISRTYKKTDGTTMSVDRWCWDAMGHKTDDVYAMSRDLGVLKVIPIQGANKYGKPYATWPKKKNDKKVYLTTVGTDNAKALIYGRLSIPYDSSKSTNPGYIHFPADENLCTEQYFKQLCSGNKKLEIKNGRRVFRWHCGYSCDEALDCWVYAYAALRLHIDRFYFVFDEDKKSSKPKGKSLAELAAALSGD